MLIGGAPGSTAGGMKMTTLAAVFLSVRSVLRRRDDVEVFGRRLESAALGQATVLITLYMGLSLCGGAAISALENVPLIAALFEASSAVATVGLSLGLTPQLGAVSKLILIFLMYLGRIGGLTLLSALAGSAKASPGRLPQEQIVIG